MTRVLRPRSNQVFRYLRSPIEQQSYTIPPLFGKPQIALILQNMTARPEMARISRKRRPLCIEAVVEETEISVGKPPWVYRLSRVIVPPNSNASHSMSLDGCESLCPACSACQPTRSFSQDNSNIMPLLEASSAGDDRTKHRTW